MATKGALTDQETEDRLTHLIDIIDKAADQEIRQIKDQTSESAIDLARELITEPRELIDEWVEKLRAFTERQTLIAFAQHRRVAKMQLYEAFNSLRESIKNEARDRIKLKMSENSKEKDNLLGDMLFQGALRLLDRTLLVHVRESDIPIVEQKYSEVIAKYRKMTGIKLNLVTSKHNLKTHYFGRIVLSNKKATIFVDSNLFKLVDRVADDVFANYIASYGKYKNPKDFGMDHLKVKGFEIMPRAANLTQAQIESLVHESHKDPRNQGPVFHIKEESTEKHVSINMDISTSLGRPRKVQLITVPQEQVVAPNRISNQTDGSSGTHSKYEFLVRHPEDSDILTRNENEDLYNLENASSVDVSSWMAQPTKTQNKRQSNCKNTECKKTEGQ